MDWKECLRIGIENVITESPSAITNGLGYLVLQLITIKILQSKEKKHKELVMKKENQKQTKRKTPERNIKQGYKKSFGVSMTESIYEDIRKEAMSRDLFVGQYLAMTHKYFMKHKRDDE